MKRFHLNLNLARGQTWPLLMLAVGAVMSGCVTTSHRTWNENSHDSVILAASARYGVDPALVKAVVWRESRFDSRGQLYPLLVVTSLRCFLRDHKAFDVMLPSYCVQL